jgi:hypothetical protein
VTIKSAAEQADAATPDRRVGSNVKAMTNASLSTSLAGPQAGG